MLNLVTVFEMLHTTLIDVCKSSGFRPKPLVQLACLHVHKASEHSQCILSASSVAGEVATDLTAYLEGIVTQQ